MKKSVLITGSGNVTGLNVVKALSNLHSVKIVGCDINDWNAANKYCANYVVPSCTDVNYFSQITSIIAKDKVEAIIVSNDHEVRVLSRYINELNNLGVQLNAFSENTINLLDKEKTSDIFKMKGILTPEKVIPSISEVPFVVRKKVVGDGKKFVYIVKSEYDYHKINGLNENDCIVTKYISGKEFTVDILCDLDSNIISIVPRLRKVVKDGIVHYAEIIYDEEVLVSAANAAKLLKLTGINCIQCIKNNDSCYFFEVNPRPGSGIDLTINAGVNMPELWLKIIDGDIVSPIEPNWGMKMIRYYEGYFYK